MVRFPNCKINLGLHILDKRADGYHNLETVFYPVAVTDALELLPAPSLPAPQLSLSGLPVEGDDRNNLCSKAWRLLRQDVPQLPAVLMHLHKAIPMGAGLGGGSADGAFVLMMLNDQFQLGLTSAQLAHYALQLGSDCPFFIYNKPCFASGRGEVLQPVSIDLRGTYCYLVNPGVHISTAAAFAGLQRTLHAHSIQDIISLPVDEWKDRLVNDFEAGMTRSYPVIAEVKQQLYEHGAVYAAMSGSGSTLFGIFTTKPSPLPFPDTYFTAIVASL